MEKNSDPPLAAYKSGADFVLDASVIHRNTLHRRPSVSCEPSTPPLRRPRLAADSSMVLRCCRRGSCKHSSQRDARLRGKYSNDTFVFAPGNDHDVVRFEPQKDQVDLTGYAALGKMRPSFTHAWPISQRCPRLGIGQGRHARGDRDQSSGLLQFRIPKKDWPHDRKRDD